MNELSLFAGLKPNKTSQRLIEIPLHKVLEKELATHSSTLAWKIPRTEEPGGGYSPWDCKESDTTERPSTHACMTTFSKNTGRPANFECQIN